jgi:uncharacterized protein YigE (DUF2233 family)
MADSNNVVTLAHREQKPVSEVSEVSDPFYLSPTPLRESFKGVRKSLTSLNGVGFTRYGNSHFAPPRPVVNFVSAAIAR